MSTSIDANLTSLRLKLNEAIAAITSKHSGTGLMPMGALPSTGCLDDPYVEPIDYSEVCVSDENIRILFQRDDLLHQKLHQIETLLCESRDSIDELIVCCANSFKSSDAEYILGISAYEISYLIEDHCSAPPIPPDPDVCGTMEFFFRPDADPNNDILFEFQLDHNGSYISGDGIYSVIKGEEGWVVTVGAHTFNATSPLFEDYQNFEECPYGQYYNDIHSMSVDIGHVI